jgi:hypothetical protein
MGKIIIPTEILGAQASDVLRREINNICINDGLDGDKIWKDVTIAKSIPDIQIILDKELNGEIIVL